MDIIKDGTKHIVLTISKSKDKEKHDVSIKYRKDISFEDAIKCLQVAIMELEDNYKEGKYNG